MRKSPLLPIFLIVAVDVLGLTLILPLLPFYAERFGASPFVVGLLVTTYALFQLVAGPFLGQISDRIGRRPVLLLSQLGTFVGFIILALSQQLWMIFLSRIIDGATAGNLSIAQAYIADVTAPQNRAKAFGIIGVAFGIGFLIGPAISGYLSQFGYQYPVYAAAGLSLTSVLATYFFLPETERHASPEAEGRRPGILQWSQYRKYFKQKELGSLLYQFFLFGLCFSIFVSGFALFSERRFTFHGVPFGPKQVGYLYAYSGFLGLILQGGLIGRLVKRFGEQKLIVSGFFSIFVGYLLLGIAPQWIFLLGLSIISSYGTGVLRPTLTSLITQTVGKQHQGLVLGMTQSLMSVAQILAPLLSGFLIDESFLTGWAWCAAFVGLIGFFLARSSFRQRGARPAAVAF
jgi:multidrug resistance protein